MNVFVPDEIHQYPSAVPGLLQTLAERTQREIKHPQMHTGRAKGRPLRSLVAMGGAELVLEVGRMRGNIASSLC